MRHSKICTVPKCTSQSSRCSWIWIGAHSVVEVSHGAHDAVEVGHGALGAVQVGHGAHGAVQVGHRAHSAVEVGRAAYGSLTFILDGHDGDVLIDVVGAGRQLQLFSSTI